MSELSVVGGTWNGKIDKCKYAASSFPSQKVVRMVRNSGDILITLGSNQPSYVGNERENVAFAIKLLENRGGRIVARSRYYRTSAFPKGSGPDFVNAVIALDWAVSPQDCLSALHQIESHLGRRREVRWGPRSVDLDLIAHGQIVLPDELTQTKWRELPAAQQVTDAPETLILPHPRLQDRAFVLVPLAEIAPEWRHPILRRSVSQMLSALDPADIADVVALA